MNLNESTTATVELAATRPMPFDANGLIRVILGPVAGLLVWLSPLPIDPTAQKVFAIVFFMIVYWVTEPVEHSVTALIGSYLFWALHVSKFSVAFSGFVSTTPWFLFGGLLIGEAATTTGLAKRLGYVVLHKLGTSYSQLLLGVITLSFLLNFLVPSGPARVSVIAPILIGIVAAFNLGRGSNVAKGLFLILSYTSVLFDKMMLSGASAILTRGILQEQAGVEIFWSQWFFAYLPAALITIFVSWLTIRWLYPAELNELPEGEKYLRESLLEMGPWTREQKKVLVWVLLALTMWATDFIHHVDPAVIGLGAGLLLILPKIGVLDTKAIRHVNFLVVAFSAGALSMGNVLIQTQALNAVTETLVSHIGPLLSNPFYASITLYWGGILYHFLLANNQSMLSTSLPLLLQVTAGHGYNPITLGLIWSFAGGSGNFFVYQSAVLVLGYSYGYFEGRDLLKVGAALTIIQAALMMALVPLYWPLIGLNWIK